MKKIFRQLMEQLEGLQSGWSSKKAKITYSPPRSFAQERERQLLKQLSTLLHAYLEEKGATGLVEVEMMHLVYDGKSFLIVAANEKTVSEKFPNSATDLGSAFQSQDTNARSEKNHRLTRYNNKIQKIESTVLFVYVKASRMVPLPLWERMPEGQVRGYIFFPFKFCTFFYSNALSTH